MPDELPGLYTELASWFHLLTAPEEYAEEAAFYSRVIEAESAIPVHTVLELGSGGGNNASHMKARFQLTLTDRSPEMLDISGDINPECEHLLGDMRNLRLGRQFDAVFIHDAVSYLTSLEDLRACVQTTLAHVRPGGVVLFVPDTVRELFQPKTDHGGHDGPDGRGLRYVEWSFDPDPSDTTCEMHMAYLLRGASGEVRVAYDRHLIGIFSRDDWLALLEEAGFESARWLPLNLSDLDPGEQELLVARAPV
jgi:SAM-dependent methyltransferase